MRCFFIGFAGFFVATVLTMIAFASYGDYAARATVSATLAATEPLRTQIAGMIARPGAPRAPVQLTAPPSLAGADYVKVAADGTIVFRSAAYGQVIVLEPSVRDNAVSWKCIGSKPAKHIPSSCH